MTDTFIFIFRYFWLLASISLVLVGDILFIIKSVQDVQDTISVYRREKKDKSYLKGKFFAPITCLICNIVLILIMASLLYYCKEVIEMRHMLSNL